MGDGKTRPDRVGHVPDAHLGRQFIRLDPLGQGLGARRDAHSLQETVDQPEHAHDIDEHRGDGRSVTRLGGNAEDQPGEEIRGPEEDVDDGAQHQAEAHDFPCTVAVGDDADDIPGEPVNDPVEGQEETELGLGDAEFGAEAGHREGEVFADEIENSVSDHRDDNRPPLPIVQFFPSFSIH